MFKELANLIKLEVKFARLLKREGFRYPLLPMGGHLDLFMRKTFIQ